MKPLNKRLWGMYNLYFPVDNEISFVIGENGTGKTYLLQYLKEYFEEIGENVIYFPETRFFTLDPKECEKIINRNGGLRRLFGVKEGFVGRYDIDPNLLNLEKHHNQFIRSGKMQLANFLCTIIKGEKESIVIIDEPERNLDLETQQTLLREIKNLKNVKKIIVATHSPSIPNNFNQWVPIEECKKEIV